MHDLPYSATPGRSLVVKHRTRECTRFGARLHLVHGRGACTKLFRDGRVLREVVEPFCQHGFNVILLNSRGVGGSTGRASFTGLPEAEDLNEVVKWLMENQFPALEELVLLVRSLHICRSGHLLEYSQHFIYRDTHMGAYQYRTLNPCQRLSRPDMSSYPIH